MADLLLVIGISGQIPRQKFFLVKEPPYEKRYYRDAWNEPPQRAERQWRAEKIQRRARVHRVAHDRIRSRRDNLLILCDLDRRCGKRIFSIHTGNKIKPDRNESVTDHNKTEIGRAH